jgi:hypothetical protein
VNLNDWIGESRHVKIKTIRKYIQQYKFVYWTDIDTHHQDLRFLSNHWSCFVASQEDSDIVDKHYKYDIEKRMSGNVIVRSQSRCLILLEEWWKLTLDIGGVVDDQWAFEKLCNDHRNDCTTMNFMSYKPGLPVLHFVGPNKIKKLKQINKPIGNLRAILDDVIKRIDSEMCFKTIPMGQIYMIMRNIEETAWDSFNPVKINDQLMNEILLKCIGFDILPRIIQKVDLLRYLIIYSHGGWYVDHDTQPIEFDVGNLTNNDPIVSIEEQFNEKVTNVICQWAFYFPIGHDILLNLILDIIGDFLLFTKMILPTSWLTGPMRFTKHILKNANKVNVLPLDSFTNRIIRHNFHGSWTKDEDWSNLNL